MVHQNISLPKFNHHAKCIYTQCQANCCFSPYCKSIHASPVKKAAFKKDLALRDPVTTHDWLVEWKIEKAFKIERFSCIDHFWYKNPEYNADELLHYVIKRPHRDEDENVVIQRTLIDRSWYKMNERPNFEKWLFWNAKFENIDWNESYAWAINRIPERGGQKDYEELIRFYGRDPVINTIRNEISFWEEVVNVEDICRYFNLAPEDTFHYHIRLKRKNFLMNLTMEGITLRHKMDAKMEKYID